MNGDGTVLHKSVVEDVSHKISQIDVANTISRVIRLIIADIDAVAFLHSRSDQCSQRSQKGHIAVEAIARNVLEVVVSNVRDKR